MHNEGVRVCAAISVLVLARALVAVPAHAGVVKATAMVTGNPVTGTSGTTHRMSDNTFFWLAVASCALVLCLPLFIRRHQVRRDHRWIR